MKEIILLLITCSSISLMGMQMDDTAIVTPIQQQLININDIDPYNQRPFSELIEEEHAADKPYLFARIETEDTPDKKDIKKYTHYVDAAGLNKALTQNIQPHFKPSEKVKNPFNNLLIKNIAYYMITKESKKTCTYVSSYNDFITPPITRWNALFRHNQLSTSNPNVTSDRAQHESAVQSATERNHLINGTPHRGAKPCCQIDCDNGHDNCCTQCVSCCIVAPILCALGIVADIVFAPCVWQNRKDNPEGAQGRHHYCFTTRWTCRECAGIASIEIQGNKTDLALLGCKADCNVPEWDSDHPNS